MMNVRHSHESVHLVKTLLQDIMSAALPHCKSQVHIATALGAARYTLLTLHCVHIVQKLTPRVLPPTGPGIAVQLPEFGPSACLLRKVGSKPVTQASVCIVLMLAISIVLWCALRMSARAKTGMLLTTPRRP
jgi:hypothetical protein